MQAIGEISRKDKMRAIVVSVADPDLEGKIAVVIPKLMAKVDPRTIAATKSPIAVNRSNTVNEELHDLISPSIEASNHYWCRPVFRDEFLVPYPGNQVYVFFEDGDPQKAYYEMTDPTLNGEVIHMKHVKATPNTLDKDKKPLVHVFKEFKDFTIVYYDENDDDKRYSVTFDTGHMISINDNPTERNIELVTTKLNRVILDDLNKHITIHTTDKHQVKLDDANKKITVDTTAGHNITMSDAEKFIKVTTTGGHDIRMDDAAKKVIVTTTGNHTINMDDAGKMVTVSSAGGNKVMLNDAAGSVILQDASGTTVTLKGGGLVMTNSAGAKMSMSGNQIHLNPTS